jgi:hypothetical protein
MSLLHAILILDAVSLSVLSPFITLLTRWNHDSGCYSHSLVLERWELNYQECYRTLQQTNLPPLGTQFLRTRIKQKSRALYSVRFPFSLTSWGSQYFSPLFFTARKQIFVFITLLLIVYGTMSAKGMPESTHLGVLSQP